MRITANTLDHHVTNINSVLGRPALRWDPGSAVDEQNVGHLCLDRNVHGWQLVEVTTAGGCERDISGRMSPREMSHFLSGLSNGMALRSLVV
jgi:hypothetical protein